MEQRCIHRQYQAYTILICQFDLHSGGRGVDLGFRLGELRHHILAIRKLPDDVIIHHNLKTIVIDAKNADDAIGIDLAFLRDLHHQVLDGALAQVNSPVVVISRVLASEADIEACNWPGVSSQNNHKI